jgi:hypothetical protein
MDKDLLSGLDLKTFNKLCKSFFDQMGFRSSKALTSEDPDRSDILVISSLPPGFQRLPKILPKTTIST